MSESVYYKIKNAVDSYGQNPEESLYSIRQEMNKNDSAEFSYTQNPEIHISELLGSSAVSLIKQSSGEIDIESHEQPSFNTATKLIDIIA